MFAQSSFDLFPQDGSQFINWNMEVDEWDPLCLTHDNGRRESDLFGIADAPSDESQESLSSPLSDSSFVSEWPIFPSELEALDSLGGRGINLHVSGDDTQDPNGSYSDTTMDIGNTTPEVKSPSYIRTRKAKERLDKKFCATLKIRKSLKPYSLKKKKKRTIPNAKHEEVKKDKPQLKLKGIKKNNLKFVGTTVVFASAIMDSLTKKTVPVPEPVPAPLLVAPSPIQLHSEEDWRSLYPSPDEALLIEEIVSKFTDSHTRVVDAFLTCMVKEYGGYVMSWSLEHIEFRITNLTDLLSIIDLAISSVTGKSSLYCRWKALRNWFEPLPQLEMLKAGPDNCCGFILSDKKRQERLDGLRRSAYRIKALTTLDAKYNPKGKLNFTLF